MSEHKCNEIPEGYYYSDYNEIQDGTYKYLDKIKFCPFCGKKIIKKERK